jgi:PhoPQ-activated pathogenicity-related protein
LLSERLIAEAQHPAEARATGDLAICGVVIRRSTLLSDEWATDALVKPLRSRAACAKMQKCT